MRTIACALVTGALLSGAAERPPPAPESYVLAQSALVQLGDAPRLYLARPDSALEAVDLRTGRVLWHTRLAVFPILVRADRLLALLPVPRGKDGWHLAVLSTRSGTILSTLPVWGQGGGLGSVGGRLGSMTTMWGVSRGGWDYVVWRAVMTPFSPVLTPNPRPGYTKTGAARVDIARGTLEPVNEGFPNPDIPVQLDRQAGYSLGPFEIEGVTAVAAVQREDPQTMRIVLRRTRGAIALPNIELCHVPWNSAGASVSVDRRNVVGACQERSERGTTRYRYDLMVHSTVTGERVGHVTSDAFPGTWLLWKDKLVFFVPERVVVEDLTRGTKLFERPLRSLRYLGPYPPRAAPPRR
jgi:hypothetical protein